MTAWVVTPGRIGSAALLAFLVASLVVANRVIAARTTDRPFREELRESEPLQRTLVVWLSAAWLFVTSTILLVPRHTADTDGRCSFALGHVTSLSYDVERILNIAMFVPAGLLFVFLGRSIKHRLVLALALLAMPPLFELLQGTQLIGRTCSATDVVDNLTGAVIGLLVATGILVFRGTDASTTGSAGTGDEGSGVRTRTGATERT